MSPERAADHGASPAPMFSFLTTAYRTEDVVGRTIRSVLGQTAQDWELVLVDNGRSEAMLAAVSPYLADPRLHLVRQENRGPAGGIASAAAVARGRYLVVLNSDDHLEPVYAERMTRHLARHPGVAAVTCDATLFSDADPATVRRRRAGRRGPSGYLDAAGVRGGSDESRPLRLAAVIDGPCPFYVAPVRRDVWEATGGMLALRDDTTKISDLDFWLRVVGAGHDVRTVRERLVHYRVEAGSVSRPAEVADAEEREAQVAAALGRAAAASGSEEDQAALGRALGRIHHEQAVRRARLALATGDAAGAAASYAAALRHRRTARTLALLTATRAAPWLVRPIYRVRRSLARVRDARRRDAAR